MLEILTNALIDVAFVVAVLGALALLSDLLEWIVKLVLSIFTTPIGAGLVEGYLTYPGVVYHELSHALFAFISGAKVCKISLKRTPMADGSGYVLGSVSFIPRGPKVLQAIQKTLSGIAPLITGMAAMAAMLAYAFPACTQTWQTVVCAYLFLCLLLHTDLSRQDLMNILAGLPLVLLVLLVVFMFAPFDVSSVIDSVVDSVAMLLSR